MTQTYQTFWSYRGIRSWVSGPKIPPKVPKTWKNICILAIIYNQFFKTAYAQKLDLSKSWIIFVVNVILWVLYTFSSFISGDYNLERVIKVQTFTTWVKCTLAIIHNQFFKDTYTHCMIVFKSWIIIVINELLWTLFTFTSLLVKISMCIWVFKSKTSQPG